MSDYETTKQQMINDCTDEDAKVSIENNYTEELHNKLQLLSQQARESING